MTDPFLIRVANEEIRVQVGDGDALAVFANDRIQGALGRSALYGITDATEAQLFGAYGIEADFVAGFYRQGFSTYSDPAEMPAWDFSRASPGIAKSAMGVYTSFASGAPRITSAGLRVEPGRTNKVDYYNANVAEAMGATAVAGITATGLTLAVVDDTAAIAAAGLSSICTSGKAIKVTNATAGALFVVIDGTTGNTNKHAVSAFVRTTTPHTAPVIGIDGSALPDSHAVTAVYQRIRSLVTPTASNKKMILRVGNGYDLYILLAQMEEGEFVTAPIVTTGDPASRAADTPLLQDLVLQQGGTILVDFSFSGSPSSDYPGGRVVLGMSGAASTDRVALFNTATGLRAVAEPAALSEGESNVGGVAAIDAVQRAAIRIKRNDFRLAANGTLGTLDDDTDVPDLVRYIGLGMYSSGANQAGVDIRRFVYFPQHLSDSALRTLSGGLPLDAEGPGWTQVEDAAAFSTRDSARTFYHAGRQYLANGFQVGSVFVNDIWKSSDGIVFEEVANSLPYEDWSVVTALDGTFYAIGPTEMWKSISAGVAGSWTKIVDPMPFSLPFDNPVIVTSAGKLLAVPGSGNLPDAQNGVWEFDPVGEAWTQVYVAAWGPRTIPTMYEFGGYLWLHGGVDLTGPPTPPEEQYTDRTTLNDLWRGNLDGTGWTQVAAEMPFQPRMWPVFARFEDRMLMMGGYDNLNPVAQNFTDTWQSLDGETWTRLETSADYTERHAAVAYPFNGRLYLASGKANLVEATQNDIWRFSE